MKPAGELDFFGGLLFDVNTPAHSYNRAFDTIIKHKLVAWSPVQGDAAVTQPLQFGSHRSKLVRVLRDGACSDRAKLNDEEWYRLIAWIDANAPYHDGFANKRPEQGAYDLAGDQTLRESLLGIHSRRCEACHLPETITRLDWIDVRRPASSLFLVAPLSKPAGGRGQCGAAVYADVEDTDYQAALGLVNTAVQKAWSRPRRDMRSLERIGLEHVSKSLSPRGIGIYTSSKFLKTPLADGPAHEWNHGSDGGYGSVRIEP
jgi:hypothetical protein